MFTSRFRRPLALLVGLMLTPITAVRGAEPDKQTEKLPIKEIVLFNSGIGFFEHRGEVAGNDKAELRFRTENVNDLLKSMVLEDLDGGRISTVSYGSRDPITRTLKTFAIDLTENPSLAEILAQLRGERVEIDAPNAIAGTIVGVEKRRRPLDGDDDGKVIEVAYLNLLTDDGLRSVSLENVGRIRLADDELNRELRDALMVLATAHDVDKKTVELQFLGEGKRRVRVGYVQEAPVWKTSYRLVLDEKKEPFLQGWAIVENTTDQDWDDVTLTLVSGRPLSFVMDLYSPLYAPRPVVEHELYASLRPPTYDQDLLVKERAFAESGRRGRPQAADGGAKGGEAKGMAGRGRAPKALERQQAEERLDMARTRDLRRESSVWDPSRGVQSLAQAGDVGELFRYAIGTPVTLKRQRSAMLPIVNQRIEGEKVSIYNEAVHAKHPLNGLKLVNTSGLHLMQGPVTVYDGGAYAGDARLGDVPAGAERLISYAMDLDVEVAPHTTGLPEQLLSVRLAKGTLHVRRKLSRSTTYTIKNSGDADRKVLVEHPLDPAWKLVAPKEPTETTRDRYRFAVTAKPGQAEKLLVQQQRTLQEQIAVMNMNDHLIGIYISAKEVSGDVKRALQEIVRRKAELSNLQHRQQQLQQQLRVIEQEQMRIRQNMAQVPRNSDLFNRYLQKFSDQEDQVEKLRTQSRQLQETESQKREELDRYLLSLDLE